jgi:hypothetical protein
MKNIVASFGFIIVLATAAQATPQAPRPVAQASQQHWLSDRLNRLVFWKMPEHEDSAQIIRH